MKLLALKAMMISVVSLCSYQVGAMTLRRQLGAEYAVTLTQCLAAADRATEAVFTVQSTLDAYVLPLAADPEFFVGAGR